MTNVPHLRNLLPGSVLLVGPGVLDKLRQSAGTFTERNGDRFLFNTIAVRESKFLPPGDALLMSPPPDPARPFAMPTIELGPERPGSIRTRYDGGFPASVVLRIPPMGSLDFEPRYRSRWLIRTRRHIKKTKRFMVLLRRGKLDDRGLISMCKHWRKLFRDRPDAVRTVNLRITAIRQSSKQKGISRGD